jgi:hypothetical protein
MNKILSDRLNQILPRITDPTFLKAEGISNEIACYIFNYPAEEELAVREHIQRLTDSLRNDHTEINTLHLDLLDVSLDYLKSRDLFERLVEMERSKGSEELLKVLKGPMAAEKICTFIAEKHQPLNYDLVLLSGLGKVWPMLRAHNLLNCLHPIMGDTPLVMFYPGRFDGMTLSLLGQVATPATTPKSTPYYRAFALIPEGNQA